MQGPADQPPAQVVEQARGLRGRDELLRPDRALRGVPSGQRLVPDDVVAVQRQDGLIGHPQFVGRQRPAQLPFQFQGVLHAVDHRIVVEGQRRSAGLLGLVQRDVSIPQQRVGTDRRALREGDADAGLDVGGRAVQHERLVDRFDDAGGDLASVALAGGRVGGEVLAQDHELITAYPGDGVDLPDRRADTTGAFDQQHVTGGVPQRVIDPLEPVQVDEQNRHGCAVTAGALQPTIDLIDQGGAILQAREAVMVGTPYQFRLRLLAFGDVLDGEHAAAAGHGPEEQRSAQGPSTRHQQHVRATPVLARGDCVLQVDGAGVLGVGGDQNRPDRLRDLGVVIQTQDHFRHRVQIEDLSVVLEHDQSRGGGVEDSLQTVALDSRFRLRGLLQPVVEVLHLLGRQAESPIVQIALFISVVVGQ